MKKILTWIGALAICAAFYVLLFYMGRLTDSDIDDLRLRLDSLSVITQDVVKFDSIQSVQDRRFLDSLESIKITLENERLLRKQETDALRQRNKELERLYRSISVPDMPDY